MVTLLAGMFQFSLAMVMELGTEASVVSESEREWSHPLLLMVGKSVQIARLRFRRFHRLWCRGLLREFRHYHHRYSLSQYRRWCFHRVRCNIIRK